jgi:hypothetical protein
VKSLNPILILRRARWYTLASTEKRWDVTEKHADVMFELADAPDLGLRNDRLQNIARRFKTNTFHEGKTIFSRGTWMCATGEQNARHSSTTSSTGTRQTLPHLILRPESLR